MRYRRVLAATVELTGDDREVFLQGQCTNDIRKLGLGRVAFAGCLTPKGKILFLFRVMKTPDRLRLLLESGRASELASHLKKFAVFTKAAITDVSESFIRFDMYGAETAPAPPGSAEAWPAFAELAASWIVPVSEAPMAESLLESLGPRIAGPDAERLRIEAGRPSWGVDFDETFLFDELAMPEAVSYTKGCYVGQEIVARVKTYGQVSRRLVRFEFPDGAPPAGSVLVRPAEPEREMGRVTSVSGDIGLGTARREVADGETLAAAAADNFAARIRPRNPE